MHRTKKILVTATAATLFMAAGVSSAMAERGNEGGDDHRVTICHATGSASNPYVEITVDEHGQDGEGVDHDGHEDDIIPAPAGGCPDGGEEPGGEEPGDDDGDCVASSTSGNSTQSQDGLINVGNINLGLNNLLGNLLCQSNVGNGLGIAVIGDALGGFVGDDDSDGGCIASSESGTSEQEQEGLINVGNINLGLNNLAGNALCQSDVLNGVAVAVLGDAIGLSPLGDGLLDDGLFGDGLLGGSGLLAGLTTDIQVVASALLYL